MTRLLAVPHKKDYNLDPLAWYKDFIAGTATVENTIEVPQESKNTILSNNSNTGIFNPQKQSH